MVWLRASLFAAVLATLGGCSNKDQPSRPALSTVQELLDQDLLEASVIAKGLDSPLAFDMDGERLYYAEGGALFSIPRAGGEATRMAAFGGVILSLVAKEGRVYAGVEGRGIHRVAQGKIERIASASRPQSLSIDGDTLRYWDGELREIDLGSSGTEVESAQEPAKPSSPLAGSFASTGTELGGMALLTKVDDSVDIAFGPSSIYVAEEGLLWRHDKSEGMRRPVAQVGGGHLALAADADHVYWGDSEGRAVYRIAHESEAIEVVSADFGLGSELAVDESYLYVCQIDGTLHRIDKKDRKRQLLTSSATTAFNKNGLALRVDGRGLAVAVEAGRWDSSGPIEIGEGSGPLPDWIPGGEIVTLGKSRSGGPESWEPPPEGAALPTPPESKTKEKMAPAKDAKADPEAALAAVEEGSYLSSLEAMNTVPALPRDLVATWAQCGLVLALEHKGGSRLLCWSRPDAAPKELWKGAGAIDAMVSSPRGDTIALTLAHHLGGEGLSARYRLELAFLSPASRKMRKAFAGKESSINLDGQILWSPDGKSIAVERGGRVELISSKSLRAKALPFLPVDTTPMNWDNRGLVVEELMNDPDGFEQSDILLIDKSMGKARSVEHPGATSPDGKWRAIPSEEGLKLISVATGKVSRVLSDESWTYGHGVFLAPQAPTWVGPHHLMTDSDSVLDLASDGASQPLRKSPYVSLVAASPDGANVVVSSSGRLYWSRRAP